MSMRNSKAATPIRSGQSLYNVIRPVDDLWLWWAAAMVLSYLVGQILGALLNQTSLITGLVSIISFFIEIKILSAYLSNFSGARWILVNIVGGVIAILALLVLGLIFTALYRLIGRTGPLPTIPLGLSVIVILGWIMALAQWRVLKDYAQDQGKRLWVIANIAALLFGGMFNIIVKELTDNLYIQVAVGTVANAIAGLIIGYTLTRLLQTYAPLPKIKGSTIKQ